MQVLSKLNVLVKTLQSKRYYTHFADKKTKIQRKYLAY